MQDVSRAAIWTQVFTQSGRDCIEKCSGSFAWYDRTSCSWRTWQRCLMTGWESFSQTWRDIGIDAESLSCFGVLNRARQHMR